MNIFYDFVVELECPVDGQIIPIEVTIESEVVVWVEDILEVVDMLKTVPTMQEPFTESLIANLPTVKQVMTIGTHGGVEITCVVNND